MDSVALENLLGQVQGCTFASLDAETYPKPAVRCLIERENVILFTNKVQESGYQDMVRRRLRAAGKDPNSFKVSKLPWGERVPNTPLIYHKGGLYLQCIVLDFGKARYFIGDAEFPPESLGIRPSFPRNQGLPKDDCVFVHTYKLESIKEIRLMGERLVAKEGAILPLMKDA